MQRADPERSHLDVEQEVLREFGNPRDLALAYEPDGTAVLRSAAGDVVVRLGRAAKAVGRGTGTFLKWIAISLAVLLVVALGVGAWAYYEVKPYIPGIIDSTEPVYQYFERCGDMPCNGAQPGDIFYVRPEAKTVRFDLELYDQRLRDEGQDLNGTARVVVVDPAGEVRYDRTFNSSAILYGTRDPYAGGGGGGLSHEASWAAVAGNWSISYTYSNFIGALAVEAYAISFPFGER